MRTLALALLFTGFCAAAVAPADAIAAPAKKAAKASRSKSSANSKERTEQEAIWRMRAALNVAALQCQYDPLLALPDRYNTFLRLHAQELSQVHTTLVKARGGQAAFDKHNTHVYNSFSTVNRQVEFCNTAADISIAAMNAPSFGLTSVAMAAQPKLAAYYTGK